MFICTCLNCGGIFEDSNPHPSLSVSYPDSMIVPSLDFHSCPNCFLDDYLVDNINPLAGGKAFEMQQRIDNVTQAGYSVDEFDWSWEQINQEYIKY